MDYSRHHFIRDILVEPETDEHAVKPLNLHLVRISRLEIKEDFRFPVHKHLWGELIIPRGEVYECTINGSRTIVEPGQLAVIQPFDCHEDFYHKGCELIFLIFNLFNLSGQLWRHGIFPKSAPGTARILRIGADSLLERLLDLILEQSGESESQMLVREKLGEAFFWQMLAEIPASLLSPQLAGSIEQRIFQHRVTEYFTEAVHERLDVRRLAVKLGMSKRSMEYKFRAIFETSPAHAFYSYKISLATQMLKHGNSVKSVAEQLGFFDQFYFSTVFKRFTGFSPSQIIKAKDLR